jgi:hypothetical protein
MEAGRELDALIAKRVFGRNMRASRLSQDAGFDAPPQYSADMSAAWQIVAAIREQPAPKRRRFLEALRYVVTRRVSPHIAHLPMRLDLPEVFWHIKPVDICRAALVFLEQEG